MKKIVIFLLTFLFLNSVMSSQNKIFAVQSKDKTKVIYCITFSNGINALFKTNLTVQGASDFGNSLLVACKEGVFLFGITKFSSFLEHKMESEEMKIEDIITAHYLYEKEYQEEEEGNIFKDKLKFIETTNIPVVGYMKYYVNKSIENIKPTETVYNHGFTYVYQQYIFSIHAPVSKNMDFQNAYDNIEQLLSNTRLYQGEIDKNRVFELYDSL